MAVAVLGMAPAQTRGREDGGPGAARVLLHRAPRRPAGRRGHARPLRREGRRASPTTRPRCRRRSTPCRKRRGEGVVLAARGPLPRRPPRSTSGRASGSIGYGAAAPGARARATARRGTRTRRTPATWSSSPAAGRRTAPSRRTRTPARSTPRSATSTSRSAPAIPAPSGVRAKYAQHCFTSHVEFRIGSGLAGVHEGGNVAEDVRFVGGEYGIWTGTPSPGWQYTLLDARFEGQRRAAIREQAAGLTLIRPHFRDVPTAIEIEAGRPDDLFVKDARLRERQRAGGDRQPREEPAHAGQHGERGLPRCRDVRALPRERAEARRRPAGTYVVKTFSHGLHYADLGAPGETKTVFDASAVAALPAPVPSDLPPLPPVDTWVSARALGALWRRDDRRHRRPAEGDRGPPHGLPADGAIRRHRHAHAAAGQRADRPAPGRDAAGRCPTARRPSRESAARSRCSRRRRAAPRS